MAGWKLTEGELKTTLITDDKFWSLFNFVFSDSSKKRNTYKFGLVKAILDSVFSAEYKDDLVFISYKVLFEKFTANYWNLIVKYHLKQMRNDGKSEFSRIEQIFLDEIKTSPFFKVLDFDVLPIPVQEKIVRSVTKTCKQYVLGALYEDTEGCIYGFSLSGDGIYLSENAHKFIMRYKCELERLNYFSWAKFLEQINDDKVLVRLLDKLEISTPRRKDLSVYRRVLEKEFEEYNCFYCGKKIKQVAHVDHFIPWTFVKEDILWNFVLSCPDCNKKKNNKIPTEIFLHKLKARNKDFCRRNDIEKFEVFYGSYNETRLDQLWHYANLSGLKIWK